MRRLPILLLSALLKVIRSKADFCTDLSLNGELNCSLDSDSSIFSVGNVYNYNLTISSSSSLPDDQISRSLNKIVSFDAQSKCSIKVLVRDPKNSKSSDKLEPLVYQWNGGQFIRYCASKSSEINPSVHEAITSIFRVPHAPHDLDDFETVTSSFENLSHKTLKSSKCTETSKKLSNTTIHRGSSIFNCENPDFSRTSFQKFESSDAKLKALVEESESQCLMRFNDNEVDNINCQETTVLNVLGEKLNFQTTVGFELLEINRRKSELDFDFDYTGFKNLVLKKASLTADFESYRNWDAADSTKLLKLVDIFNDSELDKITEIMNHPIDSTIFTKAVNYCKSFNCIHFLGKNPSKIDKTWFETLSSIENPDKRTVDYLTSILTSKSFPDYLKPDLLLSISSQIGNLVSKGLDKTTKFWVDDIISTYFDVLASSEDESKAVLGLNCLLNAERTTQASVYLRGLQANTLFTRVKKTQDSEGLTSLAGFKEQLQTDSQNTFFRDNLPRETLKHAVKKFSKHRRSLMAQVLQFSLCKSALIRDNLQSIVLDETEFDRVRILTFKSLAQASCGLNEDFEVELGIFLRKAGVSSQVGSYVNSYLPHLLGNDSPFENLDIRRFSTRKEFEYDGFKLVMDSGFTKDSPFPEYFKLFVGGRGLLATEMKYREVVKKIKETKS